jgi:hypothetical protein
MIAAPFTGAGEFPLGNLAEWKRLSTWMGSLWMTIHFTDGEEPWE